MLFALLFVLFVAAQPTQFQARMQEGTSALEKNDLAKAEFAFQQATRLAPKDASAWLLLAQTLGKQKKSTPALAAAEKAEALSGKNPDILHGLAYFYADLHPNLKKAADFESIYAENQPQDKSAWRRAAAMYLESGQPERAIEAATKGLRVDKSPELKKLLEESYFKVAQSHFQRQDFASALTVLESARKTLDKSPQIELALGVTFYGLRRFSEAVDQFLKTIELAPDVPQPYIFLGRIMEHAGNRQAEVTARFAEFQERNPNNYLGYLLHAKALIAQLPPTGFPLQAVAAFDLLQKSLAQQNNDAETHYQMGVLLERKGDFQTAASHLERSIELNGKEAAPHFRLARVYARLGRTEEAAKQRELHEKLSENAGGARPK